MIKLVIKNPEEYICINLIEATTQHNDVQKSFTHCLSAGGLMLLVYESSVYLRNERQCAWMQCMTFDSLILALSTVGTNENQQTKLMCITKTSIEILHLDHVKQIIERDIQKELPGRAVRTKLSNESWGNSNLLIMTHKNEEELLSLWCFSDELESTLLFEDSTK